MKTRNVRQRQWARWLLHQDSMERKAGNEPDKSGYCRFRISRNAWDKWVGPIVMERALRLFQRSGEIKCLRFVMPSPPVGDVPDFVHDMHVEFKAAVHEAFMDEALGDLSGPSKLVGILNMDGVQVDPMWNGQRVQVVELPDD